MKPSKRHQRAFEVHPERAAILDNIRIVLVELTHPGNIGAIARVMKNMGLSNLTLVSSTSCGPETEALTRASGAYDIVERAETVESASEAVGDCVMTVGTSARIGKKRVTARTPEEIIPELLDKAAAAPVAILFGRESKGLTNEEMKLCTHHMIVPTDQRFASMNVAHACAVIAYEIFKRSARPRGFKAEKSRPAPIADREEMYAHIEAVLTRAGFLDREHPLRMMRDLRRIFDSASMDERDVKIVRGVFRKIGNMIRIADERIRDLEARGSD